MINLGWVLLAVVISYTTTTHALLVGKNLHWHIPAAFGRSITENLHIERPLVEFIPPRACTPPLNADDLLGSIAFAVRGGCNFTSKVWNAQQAGAVAMVVADDLADDGSEKQSWAVIMFGDNDLVQNITIPAVFVNWGAGRAIRQRQRRLAAERALRLLVQQDARRCKSACSRDGTVWSLDVAACDRSCERQVAKWWREGIYVPRNNNSRGAAAMASLGLGYGAASRRPCFEQCDDAWGSKAVVIKSGRHAHKYPRVRMEHPQLYWAVNLSAAARVSPAGHRGGNTVSCTVADVDRGWAKCTDRCLDEYCDALEGTGTGTVTGDESSDQDAGVCKSVLPVNVNVAASVVHGEAGDDKWRRDEAALNATMAARCADDSLWLCATLNVSGQLLVQYQQPSMYQHWLHIGLPMLFWWALQLFAVPVVALAFVVAALHAHSWYLRNFRTIASRRLPSRLVGADAKAGRGACDAVCPICLDEYEPGVRVTTLPCKHEFHTKCLQPWLEQRSTLCPICKSPAVSEPRFAYPELEWHLDELRLLWREHGIMLLAKAFIYFLSFCVAGGILSYALLAGRQAFSDYFYPP